MSNSKQVGFSSLRLGTIRGSLIGLFLLLGAALCLSVAIQVSSAVSDWREARDLARSNQAREAMARASLAIAEERTAAYAGLPLPGEGQPALPARTDAILDQTSEALSRLGDDRGLVRIDAIRRDLSSVRSAPAPDEAAPEAGAAARDALSAYSTVIRDLLSLRLVLLAREHPTDQETAAAFQARRYLSILLDSLTLNRAILTRLALDRNGTDRAALLAQVERNSERMAVALELLQAQASFGLRSVHNELEALVRLQSARYQPTETILVRALRGMGPLPPAIIQRWQARTEDMMETGTLLLDALVRESHLRIEMQRQAALKSALFWSMIYLVGTGAVLAGMRAVVGRVIRPLEQIREGMMALAQGDTAAPLPAGGSDREMAAMADALRVFKANAIRRARLQDERLAILERLKLAYRQLRADLDSAAAVQAALLPAPARIGGVRLLGRLRPSHVISGDSFDVVRQPNGPVHFFMIDVAGHGAAAALVSVASHYTLTQAILRRSSEESLAELAAAVNRDWPDHLPYFTMVLGELRPDQGEGALVQAGHPAPLLLKSRNGVTPIGRGGLPIGVLSDAEFEEVRFAFTPGDRLLLYSDGLTEAEDGTGHGFGEERLLGILHGSHLEPSETILKAISDQVQRWRGTSELDDDMTMLMLEAVDDAHDRGGPRQHSCAAGA